MSTSTTQYSCTAFGPTTLVNGVSVTSCRAGSWQLIEHPEPTSINLTCPSSGTGTGSSSGYFLPPLTAEQGLQVGSLVFLAMATAWGFRHLVQFILNRR